MAPLAGKIVLVIGGSSGIGFGVAKAAIAEGAVVIIASSSEAKVASAAERLGGAERVKSEVVDVRSEPQVRGLFNRIGKVDHLVYTAGDPGTVLFPNTDLEAIKTRLDVRFLGMIAFAKLAKEFVGESFTTTSSSITERPIPGWSIRQGGSGAIASAANGFALDLAPIRVNCISPGLVITESWNHIPESKRIAYFEAAAAKLPLKHAGLPEEIAEAYLFAMKCTYLTGQTIFVEGGALLV